MPGLMQRLKSTEAAIAAAVAFVAGIAKYFAISKVLPLPDGLNGFAPWLSTIVVVVLVFLLLLISDWLQSRKVGLLALVIGIALLGGVFGAVSFARQVREHSVPVHCADEAENIILEPSRPSQQLQRMLDSGGGLSDAWCDHEDTQRLRLLVAKENAGQVSSLTLLMILAEALLASALTVAAWIVVNRRQRGSR
jgi:hypothetical protein